MIRDDSWLVLTPQANAAKAAGRASNRSMVASAAAKAAGVKIVISTDAHSIRGLDVMRCGILQARRAGLEAADIASTRSLADLQPLIKRRSLDHGGASLTQRKPM